MNNKRLWWRMKENKIPKVIKRLESEEIALQTEIFLSNGGVVEIGGTTKGGSNNYRSQSVPKGWSPLDFSS